MGHTKIRIMDGDERKLLEDVRLIFRDKKSGVIPSVTETVRKALEYVRDNAYQENGADVRKSEAGEL